MSLTAPIDGIESVPLQFIAKYSRTENKVPTGVIVALRNSKGKVSFGWSACDPADTFNKQIALDIALDRAIKGSKKPIHSSLEPVANADFIQRCEKYFKEEKLSFKSFAVRDGKKRLFKVDAIGPMELYYNPNSKSQTPCYPLNASNTECEEEHECCCHG